jgi:formylmethanofuran dehydrogenase subunit C
MTTLTLTLKTQPLERVDLSPLTPDRLAGLSVSEIGGLELTAGNRRSRVDELFALTGNEPGEIVIENSCDKLDRIGAGMREGTLIVHGNVGAYLGFKMQGGSLSVHGNADLFAACEMRGGWLRIAGNCGDFLGAARAGERRGMRGGLALVQGNAGDRAGDFMRRGTILIEGDAGDYCGSRMIAGTLAVLGDTGAAAGYAMRRGTLLLSRAPREMLATFNDCGAHALGFLPLLVQSWRGLPGKFSTLAPRARVRRYMGDLAAGGKGEILVWI